MIIFFAIIISLALVIIAIDVIFWIEEKDETDN